MSALDVLQRLRAADSGHAQQRTMVRHRHLERKPLVVVAYQLAGESAAPLGILWGTSPSKVNLLVAPEPRNRDIRFLEVFNPFGAMITETVARLGSDREEHNGWETCRSALQIITPNEATADFVGPLIGRSLRYLRTDGEFAVPATTVEAGAHLTWLGQQAELPGSSVLQSATGLLRRHWTVGMSDLETEDLHVLLAWIDPPARRSGAEAASRVEDERFDGTIPAAGPTPDPEWDRDVLEPLIGAFNRARSGDDSPATVRRLGRPIRSAVRDALTPAWEATWRAIELVRELPAGDSVADRWQADRRSFTNHVDRLERGDARFRTTDSVKQAAFLVRTREQAQADLDANEALDDPLVMAGVIADGAALAGTVTSIDRPDFVVELSGPCNVPVGTELFWTDMPKNASAVVTEIGGPAGDVVVMTLKQGKTKYWPEPGDWVCYSPYSLKRIPPPDMPHGVPWTHMGVSPAQAEPEVPE